jgi:hypothetical protein
VHRAWEVLPPGSPARAEARRLVTALHAPDLGRAARHLEQAGLTVLDRGWQCADGRLDIAATEAGTGARTFCAYRVIPLGTPERTAADVARARRVALRWIVAHGATFEWVQSGTITLGPLTIGRAADAWPAARVHLAGSNG